MAERKKEQANLIRVMGTDIDAEANLIYGLAQIKGISYMFANAMINVLKLDKNLKIQDLDQKQLETIEQFLTNPEKQGIPSWLLNQRNDYESGKDMHLVSKDIEFNMLQLTRRLGKIKSYRGLRLRLRLPVRGQRTKSNFRRNKTLAAMKSKSVGKK